MKYLLFILMVLLPTMCLARQGGGKPSWLSGYHKDLGNSYIDVFSGVDHTDDGARQKALQRIVDERSRASGRRYSLRENNGEVTLDSEDNLNVKCRVVDEYHRMNDNGLIEVYLLVQTARHPELAFEPVSVSDHYPLSARVIIPGLTQMYKGNTVKGACLLGGVAALGVGALFCENQRSDYQNKIHQQPKFAQSYNTKANNFETARNVCIGAAVALYIYNVIDAVAAKGKRRVVVNMNRNGGFAFCPIVSPEMGGISLAYHF